MAAGTDAAANIVYVNFGSSGPSISGTAASNVLQKTTFKINGHTVHLSGSWRKAGPNYVGSAGMAGVGIHLGASGQFLKNYAFGAPINGLNTGGGTARRHLRTAVHSLAGFTTKGNFGAGHNATHRVGPVTGYLGFKTNGGDLGWIKVKVASPGTKAGISTNVLSYAYNNVPGGAIKAGQTTVAIPEPGTMAMVLLAAGAAGLSALRRAKRVVVADAAPEDQVAEEQDEVGQH
jgi:hypothetical protein